MVMKALCFVSLLQKNDFGKTVVFFGRMFNFAAAKSYNSIMRQHCISHNAPLHFRHYSRKGYAAFRSMHREVVVGHVVNAIADRQMAKSGRSAECGAEAWGRCGFVADDDTLHDEMSLLSSAFLLMTESFVIVALQTAAEVAAASVVNNNYPNRGKAICLRAGCLSSFLKKQVLLMRKIFCLSVLMMLSLMATAQTDTVRIYGLDEVVVGGTQVKVSSDAYRVVSILGRDEIATLPVTSISDLLDYLPGIDVRTRGGQGVQADISMRGGTFDQVLVMLNGVNITDPHTGHHTLNLPIDLSMVDRIEVLQGTSISAFGLSAFSGAINIVTGNGNASEVTATVEGGAHGYFMPSVNVHQNVGLWKLTGAASYNQSTGYMENTDYKYGNIFLQARYANRRTGDFNIQLGGQLKGFGSNSFYSLKYPDQYEATKMLTGAVTWNYDFNFPMHLEASLFTRAHYDRFELFREGVVEFPAWYANHNYHVSNVSGANAKLSWLEKWGKTTVGLEVRNENILSNVLGDSLKSIHYIPYTHKEMQFTVGKNRFNVNYFAEQSFFYKDFSASLGVAGNYNTMFRNNFSFGANLGYQFAPQGQVFANVSRSLRLPTFTDLYYKSATQIANPELKPESSLNLELGVRYATHGFYTSLNAYYRFGQNIIDWVKAPEDEQWRSMNHTAVNAMGGELTVGYHGGYWLKTIEATYAFCHLNKDAGELISKYALDYLRHKATFTLSHGIYRGFGAEWQLTFQSRNGEYTDMAGNVVAYKPVLLLDGKVYWQNRNINVYASASNLTNRSYYDYGGILQPGIWVKAGIAVTINTDKK